MKDFFSVKSLEQVLEYRSHFKVMSTEEVLLSDASSRILAEDICSDVDLPDFARSTMDGYAIRASSAYGASESNPASLTIKGTVVMGKAPDFSIGPGEAARISTGGMMPEGSDSVVMIEHTECPDETTLEVWRSVAPGQHVIERGEDFKKGETVLVRGQRIRPQEAGLLAAFGFKTVRVFNKPVIGIISTGDEIVSVEETPGWGQIRDINTYTLSGLVQNAGGVPKLFGIVPDSYEALFQACSQAVAQTDMVLISGGSSVGMRDFTIEVLSALPNSQLIVHGISISPGKPTILASIQHIPVWGLPGHVVSAMIVFQMVVKPFVDHIAGLTAGNKVFGVTALLTRNLPSAQGRSDFVRVRLIEKDGTVFAEPVLGKSGLINTMVNADGLIEIGVNTEGLYKGTPVTVIPFR